MLSSKQVPADDLLYAQNAVRYLQHRKIPSSFHLCPIGVMPNALRLKKLMEQHAQLHQEPDYWEAAEKYLDFALEGSDWLGALVFFTGDSPQDPCKLKLQAVPAMTGNSFAPEDAKRRAYIPDPFEEHNGFFGLFGTSLYQPYLADKIDRFYYVEGEFDALSVFSRQFQSGDIGFFIFSGGGGSASGLDPLKKFGFHNGYVIGDWDSAGDNFARDILKNTVHMQTRVFRWPNSLAVAGVSVDIDEAVKKHGLDLVEQEIRKEENYDLPHTWALTRATKKMRGIDSEDIRYLTSTAAEWGLCVRNPAEQHAYLQEISKSFNVNAGQVSNEINQNDLSEDSFQERIKNVLQNRFHVMEKIQQGNSHILRVWDKMTEEIVDLPIGEPFRILAALEALFGKDLYEWVHEDVGDPGFMLSYEEANENHVLHQQAKRIVGYVAKGVSRLGKEVPAAANIYTIASGVHVVSPARVATEEQKTKDRFRLYMVNGTKLYRGDYEHDDKVTWKEMPGPSDGNIVVHAHKAEGTYRPQRIYPEYLSAADLNKYPKYTGQDLFEILNQMLRIGWRFKNHSVTCEFLAALAMLCSISDSIPRQPMVMFTADPQSGKTNLLGGFFGRSAVPRINVVQASVFMDNYTPAGIRQTQNNSPNLLCLDEFEDKGTNDRKTMIIRDILRTYRGTVNEECITIFGSASGKPQIFRLHHPLFVASIRPLRDLADITRFTIVEMDKKAGVHAPQDALHRQIGELKIMDVRRQMPLTMFHLAHQVHEAYFEIQEEYQAGGGLEFGELTRSREGLYGVMAVMKAIGYDYHKFAENYFDANRQHLEQVANISISGDIFNELLFTPAINLGDIDDPRPKTLSDVFSNGNAELLNESSCGIYYDKLMGWIVVNWVTAKNTILSRGTGTFRDSTVHILRAQSARYKYCIPDEQVRRSDVLERLRPYMGRLVDDAQGHISVFNVNALVSDIEKREPLPLARGCETLDLTTNYDEVKDKEFPEPPKTKPKKEGKSGTSKRTVTAGASIDDDFDY
jgi:hypothetical protein